MRRLIGVMFAVLVVSFASSASGLKAADQFTIQTELSVAIVESTPLIATEVMVANYAEVGHEIGVTNREHATYEGDSDVGRDPAEFRTVSFNFSKNYKRVDISRYTYIQNYEPVKPNTTDQNCFAKRC